jgi:hypothetical protein
LFGIWLAALDDFRPWLIREAACLLIDRFAKVSRGEASKELSMRQAALSQEPQGAADELVQIAEVAYREGEVGILEYRRDSAGFTGTDSQHRFTA